MLEYYRFKQVYDLFLRGKVDEAKEILTDLQERYIEVCDENSLLKLQMQELDDILYLAKNLIYDGFCYWLITGTIKQGPFCQHCYDRDGLLIRLHEDGDHWKCHSCGETYDRHTEPVETEVEQPLASGDNKSPKVIHLYK